MYIDCTLNEFYKEYEQLLDAMKKHEGWREGREEYTEVKKVLGVRLSRLELPNQAF